MSPKLAKRIEIDETAGPGYFSLKIDGEEFPWYIAEGGITFECTTDEKIVKATMTLLAEEISYKQYPEESK